MKYKAYPEYKESGVEWLGQIPEHWNLSKLRYMFSFGKGLTITKEQLQDEGIPCVSYGEVHSKYGFEINPKIHSLKCVSEEYLNSNADSLLLKGDIVFADTSEDLDGSGNFTQLTCDGPIFAGYHTIIARPLNRDNSRFYAYLLDSKEFRTQIKYAVKGVKVYSITQAILRSISIWVPSSLEQSKIASFLDHETAKIDQLIAKQETLIELLKEKRQAVISHVVTVRSGEKTAKMSYFVDLLPGYAFPSSGFKTEADGNIPLLRGVNVGVGSIRWESIVYWPESECYNLNTFRLQEKDIVIGMDRPWISTGARVAEITKADLPCLLLQRVARIRAGVSTYQPFVKLCLSSHEFQSFVEVDLTGISVPHLSPEQIKSFLMRNIEFDQQRRETDAALSQCDELEKIESKAILAIQLLKERRSALISAAVTGKIDVRGWKPKDIA